jgi:hypothetical protein
MVAVQRKLLTNGFRLLKSCNESDALPTPVNNNNGSYNNNNNDNYNNSNNNHTDNYNNNYNNNNNDNYNNSNNYNTDNNNNETNDNHNNDDSIDKNVLKSCTASTLPSSFNSSSSPPSLVYSTCSLDQDQVDII